MSGWDDLNLELVRTPYFASLRRTDALRNLAERYEALHRAQPELTERLLDFVPSIIQFGWVVVSFDDAPQTYTIGLSYNSDFPELMLIPAGQTPEDGTELLNMLAQLQAESGAPLPCGPDLRERFVQLGYRLVSLRFEPLTPELEGLYPCGLLYGFHIVFSDLDHRERDAAPVLVAKAFASTEAGLGLLPNLLKRPHN